MLHNVYCVNMVSELCPQANSQIFFFYRSFMCCKSQDLWYFCNLLVGMLVYIWKIPNKIYSHIYIYTVKPDYLGHMSNLDHI